MTQLAPFPDLTEFDRTTTITPVDGRPGEFDAHLDEGWASLVGAHGGFMCALAVRAASAVEPHRTARTLTTSFLRAGAIGPARLSTRTLRQGRTMSTVVVDLAQADRVVTTTRLTMTEPSAGQEWNVGPPVEVPDFDACSPPSARPDMPPHFDRVDARVDSSFQIMSGGECAQVSGYVRPLESRRIDTAWLAMICDWFPPPAFVRSAPPAGGVSIDLTVHFHQPTVELDADEWLRGRFAVETSAGGLALEHGRIARADGTTIAESMQTRMM